MEKGFVSLFEPDVILSVQYWEDFLGKFQIEPERMLRLAVLEDAILCFQKDCSGRDRTSREAGEWILEENRDWPFSFENICEILGLDPNYIRQRLLGWRKKRLTELSRAPLNFERLKSRKQSTPKLFSPGGAKKCLTHKGRAQQQLRKAG